MPWLPFGQRIDLLEATVTEVRRRLADPEHRPAPVQRPVPLMVAAMSGVGLAVAARHAEVIGFAGLRQVRGESLGTFTLVSATETAERVAAVREQVGLLIHVPNTWYMEAQGAFAQVLTIPIKPALAAA